MSLMVVVLGILTVLALVLLVKKQKAAAGVCAVLVLVLSVGRVMVTALSEHPSIQFAQVERQVMVTGLAKKVAERHPGKKIALLVRPAPEGMSEGTSAYRSTQDLLAEAFERDGIQVELVSPLSGDADRPVEGDPRSFMPIFGGGIGVGPLNKVLKDLKGRADVVICTLEPAVEFSPGRLLPAGSAPHLVLMQITHTNEYESALQSTVLDAVLMHRKNVSWNADQKLPRNEMKAFDQRFVLTTQENPEALR